MNLKDRNVLGTVIVALSVLAGVFLMGELPEQVAIHFGPGGQPDDYVGRVVALVLFPGFQAALMAMFAALRYIDPLGENIRGFGRAYDFFALSLVGFIGYIHVVILLWNAGYAFGVVQAVAPAVAALYYVVGTVLETAERNWFVGIRTPWTLSNEQVWDDTHALGGTLFKMISVPAFVAVFLPKYTVFLVAVPAVLVAVGTAVYSYWEYRRLTQTP